MRRKRTTDNELRARTASGRLIGRVRKARIEELIQRNGSMSITALASEFDVSEMTIRRDLSELEARGYIQRTHGGAVLESQGDMRLASDERFFDERRKANRAAKTAIAREAMGLVGAGQAVAVDVGTTNYELAALLAEQADIRVFTNNLRVAALMGQSQAEIYLLGGRVRQKQMSLCGPVAVDQVRRLWFDIAFLGVSALSPQGIFDFAFEEIELKHAYIERAKKRVVLADSTKFDQTSLVQISGFDFIDAVVTDAPPSPPVTAALEAAGVQLILARPALQSESVG